VSWEIRIPGVSVPEATTGERVGEDVLALLRGVSTATLSSQLLKRGFAQLFMRGVKPLRPDLRMAGQAFTLRYIPARADLGGLGGDFDNRTNRQRLAVEAVGPGDVLVIDARGDTGAGSLGNILATRVRVRGAAGIVTDGAFRDAPAFREIDLPTYAAGQHANISSTIHHPVDLNVPVACGGVTVLPGDVVVGDAEGVIVIPRATSSASIRPTSGRCGSTSGPARRTGWVDTRGGTTDLGWVPVGGRLPRPRPARGGSGLSGEAGSRPAG
jgi:regulator of RNase E activity RraA